MHIPRNICRSPTAEAVFRALVEKKGVTERFEIDSCGTGGGASGWYKDGGFSFHEGDPADGRMKVAAATRGVHLTSISRPLKPEDVAKFDVIVGMDDKNIQDMTTAIEYWRKKGHADTIPADYSKKLKRMCTYCEANKNVTSVPDPYYGGRDGFEKPYKPFTCQTMNTVEGSVTWFPALKVCINLGVPVAHGDMCRLSSVRSDACGKHRFAHCGNMFMPIVQVLDLLEDACGGLLRSLS
eukprot:jgi/Mesvir1/14827/Mv05454-RA.1